MEFWDEAVKVALLGTQRQSLAMEKLPAPVREMADRLHADDREDAFLKTAALLMNYGLAGRNNPALNFRLPQPAAPEEKPGCSDASLHVLATILEEGYPTLLPVWLHTCRHHRQLVRADYIPVLLDEGKKHIALRPLISAVTGNRGKWLAAFNDDWHYLNRTNQEIWEHGKSQERLQVLLQHRQENPESARQLLKGVWKEESANNRAELAGTFSENLSLADEPLLAELLSDKSQKVREAVSSLLDQLPGSARVEDLWNEVKSWLALQVSKSFLAFSKEELQVTIPESLPPDLKRRGFQELSGSKELSDQYFWLKQALEHIPPSYWETQFTAAPGKILNLFSRHKSLKKMIPALWAATVNFKDAHWAKAFLDELLQEKEWIKVPDANQVYQLLRLLPEATQQTYLDNKKDKNSGPFGLSTLDFLIGLPFAWDLPFSIKAMRQLAHEFSFSNMYGIYYRLFDLHLSLHPEVLNHLQAIEPPDPAHSSRWHSLQSKLTRSLELRQQLQESFTLP